MTKKHAKLPSQQVVTKNGAFLVIIYPRLADLEVSNSPSNVNPHVHISFVNFDNTNNLS